MSEWKLGYDIGGTKCAAILEKVSDNKISVVEKASVDGNAYQRRSKEYHRPGGKARFETTVRNAGTCLEQPCSGHC